MWIIVGVVGFEPTQNFRSTGVKTQRHAISRYSNLAIRVGFEPTISKFKAWCVCHSTTGQCSLSYHQIRSLCKSNHISVIPRGFEPLTTDPESVVIPFHHGTIKNPFNHQTERVNILAISFHINLFD